MINAGRLLRIATNQKCRCRLRRRSRRIQTVTNPATHINQGSLPRSRTISPSKVYSCFGHTPPSTIYLFPSRSSQVTNALTPKCSRGDTGVRGNHESAVIRTTSELDTLGDIHDDNCSSEPTLLPCGTITSPPIQQPRGSYEIAPAGEATYERGESTPRYEIGAVV